MIGVIPVYYQDVSSIVGYVAIQDMMQAADIIRSRTYDAYFLLLFVAIVYLIITTLCVQRFNWR